MDPERKFAQPEPFHQYIDQRPGYEICGQHPSGEVLVEMEDDAFYRGTEDLPYTNLFDALLHGEGRQPEQSQTGNEHR